MTKKETLIQNLTADQTEALIKHFDAIYECHELSETEYKIIFLAWLWAKNYVKDLGDGFLIFDEAEAGVPLSDYEITFEAESSGGVNLNLIHSYYEIVIIIEILEFRYPFAIEKLKGQARKFLDELDSQNSTTDEEAEELGLKMDQFTESEMSEAFDRADAYQVLVEKFSACVAIIGHENDEEIMIRVADLAEYLDEYWIYNGFDKEILYALLNFLERYNEAEYGRLQIPIIRCMYDFTANRNAAVDILFYIAHVADETYKGYIKLQAKKLLKSSSSFSGEELFNLNYLIEIQ